MGTSGGDALESIFTQYTISYLIPNIGEYWNISAAPVLPCDATLKKKKNC